MGNTQPGANNLNRSNPRQTNHQNYSQSSSNHKSKNVETKTFNNISDSEDSDEQVLFESCLKSKSKSSSNIASKNSNSSNIYVKDSNNLTNNVDSLQRPNSNSVSNFSNSTTAIETPKDDRNISQPSSDIGNFFSSLFSGDGAFQTSLSNHKRQTPRHEQIISKFFSQSASNLPSTIFNANSNRLENRPKIFHKNGMVYMLIDGKIFALPKEQKCQFCNKMINPVKEDFEIHQVKCMTKPRIKMISFVLKECDIVDSSKNSEVSQDFKINETKSSGNNLIQNNHIIDNQNSYKNLIGVECTICFEEYKYGDTLSRLECFCVFHKQCINGWMSRKQCCPLHHLMDDDKN